MIKVAHIISDLKIGGAEIMLYKLLSGINRDHCNSIVISISDNGLLSYRLGSINIPVYSLGMEPPRPSIKGFWKLLFFIREFRPDLIQGWLYHGNLAAQAASFIHLNRIPVLWNIRQSLYSLKDEKKTSAALIKLTVPLSRYPAYILYNSETSRNQHENLGYCKSKGILIPNGFDTNIFKPSEKSRYDLRAQLNLAPDTILIGLVARYHPHKDINNFLQAAAILVRTWPDACFVMIGRGFDNENTSLIKHLSDSGLKDNFHLLGEQKEIQKFTAALDILSISSLTEAFPNVIGEAMACGVPCVATDVGDTPVLIGETGVVVPPRNPEALAAGWNKLIDMGKEGRISLGALARKRIVNCYSLPEIVSKYESLYEKAVFRKNIL